MEILEKVNAFLQKVTQKNAGMPSKLRGMPAWILILDSDYSAGTAFQTPFPTILPISIFEMTVPF